MPLEPLTDTGGLWTKLRALLFAALGFVALLGINLIQLLSLVLLPFSARAFRAVNCWCAGTWWGWCVTFAEKANKTEIVFSGSDVPLCEDVLLVANHQQMPDITAIMKFAKTKDRLGDLKFFVKKQLKWVPGLGWGMQFLDCLYIDRDWTADQNSIEKTFSNLVNNSVPVYLVSFVEGTRFTMAKLENARAFARDHGLREPRHTLVPRTKGFAASVEGLRSHITSVYDLTIGYEGGVPSLWQYVKGLVARIHVHVRRYEIESLPDSADGLRQWLFDRWEEKDSLLDHFYATGAFPGEMTAKAGDQG